MTADRDPQVAALLDVLETVPPRPGFWEDLEARLRAEPVTVDLAPVPAGRGRRDDPWAARRRRTLVGVAAAAAAVAALVGGLALRDDDRERSETVPVDEGSTTTSPPTTAPTTEPTREPTTEATYAAGGPELIALRGADLWIEATQSGDDELAWQLLGGVSQDQIGSQAALAELPLDEEWGPYIDSPDRREAIVPLGEDLWMIVLNVDSEADLVPPRIVVVNAPPASEYSINPYLPGADLDLIGVPALGGMMLMPGAAVPLRLDADASVVAVVLDGRVLDVDDAELVLRDDDGAVTGVRPDPDLSIGVHSIAVLQIVDGELAADARLFQVGSGAG